MRQQAQAAAGSYTPGGWRTCWVVALCCASLFFARSAEAQLPEGHPGQTIRLVVKVPVVSGVRPATFHITAAHGVTLTGVPSAPLGAEGEITVAATLPPTPGPRLFSAATVTFVYPDGEPVALDCYIWVLATASSDAAPEPNAASGSPPLGAPEYIATHRTDDPRIPPAVRESATATRRQGTLNGVAYAGATDLGIRGRSDADFGMGIDLTGRLKGSTHMNAVYLHGWNPGLSPVFRYGMNRSRGHLRIRAPQWSLEAGEIRSQNGLAGLATVADGGSFQKTRGSLIGSVVVGRPKYYAGGWGGHLFQGSVGAGFRGGSVSLLASDVARPITASRIAANPAPEDNSELITEDLERVGALLSREDRVRSAGIETRLHFKGHDIVARGGWLEFVNSGNERVAGAAASANYSFRSDHGSLSGSFRRSLPALPGIAVPGDLVTLNGKLTVVSPFALIGRTYWNESSLFGRNRPTRSRGIAAGVEYLKQKNRAYLQANHRESSYVSTAITRSISGGVRMPMGIAGVDSAVEYGEVSDGRRQRTIATFRGSVYAEGKTASLMLSGSYRDYGLSSGPRLSVDLSGSVAWRRTTVEGGAGVSRAGIFGDVANAWTTVEFPLRGDLTIMLGADYDRWSLENSPYLVFLQDDQDQAPPWRFTFSVRRKLSLDLPFLR